MNCFWRRKIKIYVVYFNPSDFPGRYVRRIQCTEKGHILYSPTLFANEATLDALRDKIPMDCVRLDRHPEDDPVIVETWI